MLRKAAMTFIWKQPMTRFNIGQIVRVTYPCSLAYGRVAQVVVTEPPQVKVQFVDLPKSASGSQCCAGSFATFESNELTPVNDIPTAAFYLLVTVIERDGDRRYVHHCLALGQTGQQPVQVANGVVQARYGSGGKWDADEQVYRFGCYHFVLAEDWCEISLAQYANFQDVLKDFTTDGV